MGTHHDQAGRSGLYLMWMRENGGSCELCYFTLVLSASYHLFGEQIYMYRSSRLVIYLFSLSICRYLYLAGHVTSWIYNTPLLLRALPLAPRTGTTPKMVSNVVIEGRS